MAELLACRTCLITDVKLYDMFKYKLAEPFALLTRTEDLGQGLPQHMCGICASVLLRSVTFQIQCNTAMRVLQKAVTQETELTMQFVRSIDRSVYSFGPALAFTPIEQNNYIHEANIDVKKYTDQDTSDELMDIEVHNIKLDIEQDENLSDNEVEAKLENSDSEDVCVLCDYFGVDKCDEMMEGFPNETGNEISDDQNDSNDIKVILLDKEQQVEELLKNKESVQYLTAKYRCDKCYKSYNIEYMYRAHMKHHDPESGELVCEVCRRRYSQRHEFNNHVKSHERRYQCQQCQHVSKDLWTAKKHLSVFHEEVEYACEPCGESFTVHNAYAAHMRTKHAEHRCDLCGDCFTTFKGLRHHRVITHLNKVEALKHCKDNVCMSCNTNFDSPEALEAHKGGESTCNTDMKPCVACGAGFETEKELKEHKKIHRKKPSVKCQLCDKMFADRYSYRTHYKENHFKGTHKPDQQTKPKMASVCEVCGKICRTPFGLRAHQARAHCGAAPKHKHVCNQCGQTFATSNHLMVHYRKHTGERPFQCERCPKAFYTRPALVTHTRIHTGEKPFLCEFCGKAFTQSKTRKIHIMGVHKDLVGGKRFPCSMCPKTFSLASYLKEHLRRHTGEKPYKCEICSRPFTSPGELHGHKKIHARRVGIDEPYKRRTRNNIGEKPYECKSCPKAFFNSSSLYTHNKLKHSEGAFTCSECNVVFDSYSSRKIHILKEHRGKKAYSCPHCDQVFGYSFTMNDHIAMQHLGTKPKRVKKKTKQEDTENANETETAGLKCTDIEARPKKRRAEKPSEGEGTEFEQSSDLESERRYLYVEAEERQYLVVSNEEDE